VAGGHGISLRRRCFAKEVFGGTGMNILNVALTARAFLFFAYPAQISGDRALDRCADFLDGNSGATVLSPARPRACRFYEGADAGGRVGPARSAGLRARQQWARPRPSPVCWAPCFLILTQVGSWRTMAGVVLGTAAMAYVFNVLGSDTNPLLQRAFLLAHRAGRLGLRHGLHGHRSGDLGLSATRASGFMGIGIGAHGRADPRRSTRPTRKA
jgi:hypothetical protein